LLQRAGQKTKALAGFDLAVPPGAPVPVSFRARLGAIPAPGRASS